MDSDQIYFFNVFNDLDLNEAVPPIFWMHIGRLLGYRTCPSSASYQHAGITFITRVFCQSLYEGYCERYCLLLLVNTQIDMAFDKTKEYYNRHCATWKLPKLDSEKVTNALKKNCQGQLEKCTTS